MIDFIYDKININFLLFFFLFYFDGIFQFNIKIKILEERKILFFSKIILFSLKINNNNKFKKWNIVE